MYLHKFQIKSINPTNIFNSPSKLIGRRGLEKLDFLLLLIETVEINGVYSILQASKELGVENCFSNRVELWKRRAHNPLRRSSRRGKLNNADVHALILLISGSSNRLYPLLRQLLSNREPKDIQQTRWELLSQRFNELIKERMNLKRSVIQNILSKERSNSFLKDLVFLLALSSGPHGISRLKTYLYCIN